MMKKSLIALAVMAASSAAFAGADVYGQARIAYTDTNTATGDISNQASRIGVKGSEDLGGGLTAVYGFEWGVNLGTSGATTVAPSTAATAVTEHAVTDNGLSARNQFVGLKGAFGTVLAGNHDTPYKLGGSADVFGDTAADSQGGGTGIIGRNTLDNRAANAIAYISPDWNGFHFAAAGVTRDANTTGASALAATSYVLVYANGPLKATLGQETFKDAQRGTKLNVSYKIGDIGLGYTHEDSKTSPTAAKDKADLMSVTYGMGPITLAAQYGKFNDDATADVKRTTVGVVYALSKKTNAALAYTKDDNQTAADTNATTLQLNHSF